MKNIVGFKLHNNNTLQGALICSEIMRECFRSLTKKYPILYSQFLFPYVDALSLADIGGTEGTHIFGTHAVLSNISPGLLNEMFDCAVADTSQKLDINAVDLTKSLSAEIIEFKTTDGAVEAYRISDFLFVDASEEGVTVGNYADMLSGFMQPWQLRETSRVFSSFVEMSYRKSKKNAKVLLGGKLLLTPKFDNIDEIKSIYTKKTGCLG